MSDVLNDLDKDSSRSEIRKACINANNLKEKHIQSIKTLKDNSCRGVESELSKKKKHEMDINNLRSKKIEIENTFNVIEYGLKDLDPTLAALVYNKYITVQNVENYGEWGFKPIVRKGVKISKVDWDYMERNKIVERVWKQGFEWSYAINIILKVKEFAEHVGKNKRRNNVTELELYQDKAKFMKDKDNAIKKHEENIIECNKKIEAIKNSDEFNLDLDSATGDTLTTYKQHVNTYGAIEFEEGTIFKKNILIGDTKLDFVALNKDNDVVIYIQDTIKADGPVYEQIANRYLNAKFQRLRNIAKYVYIYLDVIYKDSDHAYREQVPLHNLKNWCDIFIFDSILDERLSNAYKDKIEPKYEDELRYLIALDMSKKFLY